MASFAELVAAADRAALAVFGESVPVVYTPNGGADVEVSGIFDLQYELVKGSAEAGVSALGPAVFLRLEDLPDDPQLADNEPTLIIRGVTYVATEYKPDGLGGVVIALRRAA